jgi:hypothetical protein
MMLHAHRISFIGLPTSSNTINGEMLVEGRLYDVKCDPEPNLLWTSLFSAASTVKGSREDGQEISLQKGSRTTERR